MSEHTFVAVYTGETVSSARLVWASADPELVRAVSARMLRESEAASQYTPDDPISQARGAALRRVAARSAQ